MCDEPDGQFGEISQLLKQLQDGHETAQGELFMLINDRLRGLARGLMKSERPDHTLQATALVNEACAKMLSQGVVDSAQNRRHLFSAAARSMRQVLIDHARARNTAKRGRNFVQHPLDVVLDRFEEKHNARFDDLEVALERLQSHSDRQYEVLTLRFFAGLTIEQVAEVLECSVGTIETDWRLARAKLHTWLQQD